MASLRAVYLQPEEIDRIVTPLLAKGFKRYGFHGKLIQEDETFSGDPIIRVRADVDKPVPASELVSVLGDIHAALRTQNDERFVFLSAPGPKLDAVGGDEDEEI
jgi:hypothetical protein